MRDFVQRYGQWALVTGGTSGIGDALVRQLAAMGMNVVLIARTQSKLDGQAAKLRRDFSVEVRTVAADLSAPTAAATVIAAVEDLEIGVFIPCAALESRGYFVDTPLNQHLALLQMNVITPTILIHHFGAQMAARGRGAVLLVSSLAGWMAQPYMAAYGAAKAHTLALGAALYQEMQDKGVDVTVLSPGWTDTPMAADTGIDFAAMGMAVMTPDAVAAEALGALSRRADAIPGVRNRFMVFMMTRLMPRAFSGRMFKQMLGKALDLAK